MRRLIYCVVMISTFIALFPLSDRLAEDRFFTRPFDSTLFDPVLLVCSDHVEVLQWRNLVSKNDFSPKAGCTFQIDPQRQKWVESSVKHLQSPNPNKSSWVIHVQQFSAMHQRIDLELLGDGVSGLTYEVDGNHISPLKSRLTGPAGALPILALNISLWAALWLIIWLITKRMARRPRSLEAWGLAI